MTDQTVILILLAAITANVIWLDLACMFRRRK